MVCVFVYLWHGCFIVCDLWHLHNYICWWLNGRKCVAHALASVILDRGGGITNKLSHLCFRAANVSWLMIYICDLACAAIASDLHTRTTDWSRYTLKVSMDWTVFTIKTWGNNYYSERFPSDVGVQITPKSESDIRQRTITCWKHVNSWYGLCNRRNSDWASLFGERWVHG